MSVIPSHSVRIILSVPSGEFLLVCESDDQDNWKLPGGSLEKDEDPGVGVKRELMEELGLDAKDVRLHLAAKLTNDDGIHARWIYDGIIPTQDYVRPTSEISSVRFVTRHTIPDCKNTHHIAAAYDAALANNARQTNFGSRFLLQ